MNRIHRRLVFSALAIAAGALTIAASRPPVRVFNPRAEIDARDHYGPERVEHYLSKEDFIYLRPGYNLTVNSVTIGADNKPVVDLTFTDDLGQPLDRLGVQTPGALSVSFVLSWYDPATRNYTSYITRVATAGPTSPHPGATAIQATGDTGGAWTDLAVGHATYKFNNAMPAGFDRTRTHTLGLYGTRNTTAFIGKNYFAKNVEYDFRPDGGTISNRWGLLEATSSACNNCHNPLGLHGGARKDVKLCVLCHSPQSTDPNSGNTVDFKVLIHKIHSGSSLPSVKAGTPFFIGNSTHDFSTVVFPQDIRNCEKCHAPSAAALDSTAWMTKPSRAACGSCHDDIDWTTGANHPAGAQADDSACAACHVPQGDLEYDASIQGAHTVPYKSAQLKGINATILSVTNTQPGQKPTIRFQLKQNDGTAIAPATLGSNLNVLMGGPTTDYGVSALTFRQRADSASFDGTTATYTMTTAIPADATGTWAFGMEARRTVTLNPGPRKGANINESAFNPVFYAAVTDSTPVPRRKAVAMENCNRCHDQLAPHGRGRRNVELCVICHNPNQADRRPASMYPPESVDFKRQIHRIHTGEDLTRDFTIVGSSGNGDNFNEVRFPGDRRDCQTCHVAGAYQVSDNPPAGLLPTVTLRDWYSPQNHFAAACLGCHDSQAAAAHAFQMTAPFGESCAVCHGTDSEFAVDKVHAR